MRVTKTIAVVLSLAVLSSATYSDNYYYKIYESTAGDILSFVSGLSKGLVGEDLGQDIK